MESKVILKKILIYLIIFKLLIIQSGCYSYSKGELVRKDEIEGSRKVIKFNYRLATFKAPTKNDASIIVKYEEEPIFSFKAIEKYEELNSPTFFYLLTYTFIVVSTLGFGALLIFIIDPEIHRWVNNSNNNQWKTIEVEGREIKCYKTSWDYYETTGRTIDGNSIELTEEGGFKPKPKRNLRITLNSINKEYITNNEGLIKVDLIDDFSLKSFNAPKLIEILIKPDGIDQNYQIELNSTDWTVPFFRVNTNAVQIENEENGKIIEIGTAVKGEFFLIIHESGDLIKIKYHNQEGYIPKNAGEKFWAIPDYH